MDVNDVKTLNRSFSFSGSPVSQRISVEELFKCKDGNYVVKKYSFEQSYDKKSQQPLKIKQTCSFQHNDKLIEINKVDEVIDPKTEKALRQFPINTPYDFNFAKECSDQTGFKNFLSQSRTLKITPEYTPMEVDNDISMSDVHNKRGFISSSSKHVSKVPKMSRPAKCEIYTKRSKFLQIILCVCVPILIAILLYSGQKSEMTLNFENENITKQLEELLYGQANVVSKIKDMFIKSNDKEVLVFTGGVGVGKTYTAHIIATNYPWNIINVRTQEIFNVVNKEKEIFESLVNNQYNLVIIDNLEPNESVDVISFIKLLVSTDKKIYVIVVFNIQTYSLEMAVRNDLIITSKKIEEEFLQKGVHHNLFIFNDLSVESVQKCIKYAMYKRFKQIEDKTVNYVLQNINYKFSGCKGVYSKVAVFA